MYSLTVRDHIMIAHSFQGAIFGPAQRMHGATYIVDACFQRSELDADGLVVDIGLASEVLKATLAELNFRNLDEVPEFHGRNTTTEFMARVIFERMAAAIRASAPSRSIWIRRWGLASSTPERTPTLLYCRSALRSIAFMFCQVSRWRGPWGPHWLVCVFNNSNCCVR